MSDHIDDISTHSWTLNKTWSQRGKSEDRGDILLKTQHIRSMSTFIEGEFADLHRQVIDFKEISSRIDGLLGRESLDSGIKISKILERAEYCPSHFKNGKIYLRWSFKCRYWDVYAIKKLSHIYYLSHPEDLHLSIELVYPGLGYI